MFVYLDANKIAVAWNLDGTAFAEADIPAGATSLNATAEQFSALKALRKTALWTGTRFIPASVTAGNFMRALITLNRYDSIDAAVATLPGQQGKIAKALWNRATEFPRNDPLVAQVATAVGMTSSDIDDVYALAGTY